MQSQPTLAPIQTRDEAEASMALVTSYQVQLEGEQAAQNKELLIPRKRDAKILELRKKIGAQSARLGEWADKDRKTWGESKSIELRQGTVGFKSGNRFVELLKGWDDMTVVEKLRKGGKKFAAYVNTTYSLARGSILADTREGAAVISEKDLLRFGVRIGQMESFFVKPKIETAPK